MKCRYADPGPTRTVTSLWAPDQQRTASRCAASGARKRLLLLPIEHELRHLPFEADGEETEREADCEGEQRPDLIVQGQPEGGGVEQSGDDGDAGIELGAEQQRHVVAEDVAEHAAGTARD